MDTKEALAVLAREEKFLHQRLTSYRRLADNAARRRGERVIPADDLAERTEQRLTDYRAAIASLSALNPPRGGGEE